MSNKAPKSALESLPEKQRLFVHEYMADLNATAAAIRANYSERTARQQASRLLSNVNIQNAIAELKSGRNERLNIDADYVLRRLLEVDQLDVVDILDSSGAIKQVN